MRSTRRKLTAINKTKTINAKMIIDFLKPKIFTANPLLFLRILVAPCSRVNKSNYLSYAACLSPVPSSLLPVDFR